jgi:hypothetical protein
MKRRGNLRRIPVESGGENGAVSERDWMSDLFVAILFVMYVPVFFVLLVI